MTSNMVLCLPPPLRPLPLPAPYDKHELNGGPAPRFDRPWSWWRTWAKACWDRTRWYKKDVNRVLDLRFYDSANRGVDWAHCSAWWESSGFVYGIYHFATGRWYVGQTVRTIHQRAYDHWTSRFRNADLFHQSLALDADPFEFIALPLEFISRERYYKKGMQQKNEVTKFREVATPRERYWVRG